MAGLDSLGAKRSMGIQFVKSSNNDDMQSFFNNTGPSAKCSESSSRGSVKSAPFQFGGPAKQFDSYRDKVQPMQRFVRPGEGYKSYNGGNSQPAWRENGSLVSGSNSKGSFSQQQTFPRTPTAKFVLSPQEYQKLWRQEKDPSLVKIRKLAWEVANLKSDRPNAIDKLHSASNRVPARIEFNTEPVFGSRGNNSFRCHVFVESILIGSGQGIKIKDSKVNAYEAALQKILMPELRVNRLDFESRELEGSKEPFTSPPPEPSNTILPKSSAQLPPSYKEDGKPRQRDKKDHISQHKESNLEAASVKRRIDEQRPLEDFVIVEPLVPIPDCTPAHTVRRSADFNHMLLEYEYFFYGEAVRCVMWVEGKMLANVNGGSKLAAKNKAAEQGLRKLKEICWVIKTKQAVDSDTKISKEEMLNELTDQSDILSDNNVGNKMLRKMGWSGGGVGRDGSGIAEPVSLKSVLNREVLGLGAEKGITDEYRRRVKEVIENYAASGNQEDLVFNCDFRLEERLIIHDECRRLNLRSKCKGKGAARYLCVRRKRSANMLFDHIVSCGGETIRYKLVPPGEDNGESYLPRKPGNGSSNEQSNGQDVKINSSLLREASSMNACNDLSPPEKIKKELNDEDSRVKQEVKQEFVSPSQSLMTSNTYTNFKDEKWSNIHEHGNMQNGFENSSFKFTETITKSPYNNLLASIEMKKEHVPNYDQEGAREANQELGPQSLSLINGDCKYEGWELKSFIAEGSQNVGNHASLNEDACREPNSLTFSNSFRNKEEYHEDYHPHRPQNQYPNSRSNFDFRNGQCFIQNPCGSRMSSSAIGQHFNHSFTSASDHNIRMQQNRMDPSNHYTKQFNGNGFFNQSRNDHAFSMQTPCNNMNPAISGSGQWVGRHALNPHQSQNCLQNAAQNFSQMAAHWMGAQQGANMTLNDGPRISTNVHHFHGCGRGRGSSM